MAKLVILQGDMGSSVVKMLEILKTRITKFHMSYVQYVYQSVELTKYSHSNHRCYLGAVHILRQPPEGGEGVSQMLTIADEGGKSKRKI